MEESDNVASHEEGLKIIIHDHTVQENKYKHAMSAQDGFRSEAEQEDRSEYESIWYKREKTKTLHWPSSTQHPTPSLRTFLKNFLQQSPCHRSCILPLTGLQSMFPILPIAQHPYHPVLTMEYHD